MAGMEGTERKGVKHIKHMVSISTPAITMSPSSDISAHQLPLTWMVFQSKYFGLWPALPGSIPLTPPLPLQELFYEDRHYHEHCFRCFRCDRSLADEPFTSQEEALLCNDCYCNEFSSKCVACDKTVMPGTQTWYCLPWLVGGTNRKSQKRAGIHDNTSGGCWGEQMEWHQIMCLKYLTTFQYHYHEPVLLCTTPFDIIELSRAELCRARRVTHPS